MLKDQLLYNEEMQQYDNVITKKSHRMTTANCINSDEVANNSVNSDDIIMPSSVYGVYHLLRLFGIHYNCRDAAYMIYCIYSMYNLHVIVVFYFLVKIPLFLLQAKFPSSHIHLLNQHFKDFHT